MRRFLNFQPIRMHYWPCQPCLNSNHNKNAFFVGDLLGIFVPGLVWFGSVVSEKMKMWKVYRQRRTDDRSSDGNSSRCLWQVELKNRKNRQKKSKFTAQLMDFHLGGFVSIWGEIRPYFSTPQDPYGSEHHSNLWFKTIYHMIKDNEALLQV